MKFWPCASSETQTATCSAHSKRQAMDCGLPKTAAVSSKCGKRPTCPTSSPRSRDAKVSNNLSQYAQAWLDADRKSTRLNSSHVAISYAVFCLKKKKE